MSAEDRDVAAHREWLNLVPKVGLVVSAPALLKAGAVPEKNVVDLQQRFQRIVRRTVKRGRSEEPGYVDDWPALFHDVLDWQLQDLLGPGGSGDVPDDIAVPLPTYGEVLRPTWVVRDSMGGGKPLLLVQRVGRGVSLDDPPKDQPKTGWHAAPEAKFERLLSSTGVRAGLLTNDEAIRLVYTPEHQTSGHITFPIQAMTEVPGRPILAAFHMLLREQRVFSAVEKKRLLDILATSRDYQNEVSTALADQVLGALWDLLRGFQEADAHTGGRLLATATAEDREHVYGGLLTALMRMVFLLYAEDQGLLPHDPVWTRNYSVAGLYLRLRDDHALYPDTMDQRYGAWSSLLALFRLVYLGGGHGDLRLPSRKGQLFDPDAYPFLEGRPRNSKHDPDARIEAPRVSDGCAFRILQGLLVLDGERLSYRALDVEQIGSVYEAMMGFNVERVSGTALAVGQAGIVFNVDELLAQSDRKKWLKEATGAELAAGGLDSLKKAKTPDDVFAALGKRVSKRTPRPLQPGSLVLQPGEERRRSGSHYTPRQLTQPIVSTTLRPVLEALGSNPKPEQILDLKVCDPAMGSGAFLVEACRQLAERLVAAWDAHHCTPTIPPDEDALLHAKRLIAQRCLYGVDKNPFAVNLAKLSLWLVTLAKEHTFTFVDHALRHGDSLVGLTREQIARFHWDVGVGKRMPLLERTLKADTDTARARRGEIECLGDGGEDAKRTMLAEAEAALADPRLAGDLVVAAFFSGERASEREQKLAEFRAGLDRMGAGKDGRAPLEVAALELRHGPHSIPPFHWELEFPEVFGRENAGFDAIVGNPPFLGGTMISTAAGDRYLGWLCESFDGAGNRTDLVAYFLRRAYEVLRTGGTFGLVATNTVGQGDTRAGGLAEIRRGGGWIYSATRRLRWPGAAAVIVSVVHVRKGVDGPSPTVLDGHAVGMISSYLFHAGNDDSPARLRAADGLCFEGFKPAGNGFLFDDDDPDATPLSEIQQVVQAEPGAASLIQPFIGGEEVNSHPDQRHTRWAINFGRMSLEEAERFPLLLSIVRAKVKPVRDRSAREAHRRRWWQFGETRPGLVAGLIGLRRVLVIARVGQHGAFTFLPAGMAYSEALVVFALDSFACFAALQSRPHEIWARFFGSSLKDDLRYTPSDVVETFCFPLGWRDHPALEAAGKAYYDFRAALMVQRNEGLTKTYNRFHNPEERSPDIARLRELHDAMDRAVLDAYGWTDIRPKCEFLLDYEIDEEEWGTKKKPYRYRWPDDVRDEVLGRLLELNRQRAEEERLAGPAPKKVEPPKAKIKSLPRAKQVAEDTPLFGSGESGS